jgi:LytS/YehU family sensor histidine kinase
MYATFGLAYVLIQILQRLFPLALAEEKFWPQLLLHIAAIFFVGRLFGPMLTQTQLAQLPQPSVIPLVYTLLQITLFVVAKTFILQRERHLATQINLRQAQLNMLRSQSNPHFMFNTLNLLASEIKRNPATAQDIVYDLADLLRESMRAAEREFISLDEELRLASLYLEIQQKRFPERLVFNLDSEESCGRLIVPSLLLQPVVENVIKHVVSRSNSMTSLHLWTRIENDSVVIGIQDNGPQIDTSSLKPGEGLRILRETLALHYRKRAKVIFESTRDGCRVTISLPLQDALPGN